MPKRKQTYEFTLNVDQMNYIGWAKRKYELPDDSKTVRIILDYVMQNRDLNPAIFSQVRCLHC